MISKEALELAASFGGTIGFAILFGVKPKHYFSCGIIGLIGWMVYLIAVGIGEGSGDSKMWGMFFAACAVAIVSRFFSVEFRAPTPVFLIPGIFPIVPGASIFYMAYYLFMGNSELTAYYMGATFKTAAAIALGIGVAYCVPASFYGWKQDSQVWLEGEHRKT